MSIFDTARPAGVVRAVGAAAAVYVAATGRAPGLVRAALGLAALALGVNAWGNLTEPTDTAS